MSEQPLVFRCAGEELLGILHPASGSQLGVVVVVGGPQYRVGSHRQFVLMARDFARAGLPVLRFDYRGMGDSSGPSRGFEHVNEDIRAAIDALLAASPGLTGVILWGLCDAASALCMYCSTNDRRVKGLILANPWVHTTQGEARAYIKHYYLARLMQRGFWKKVFSGQFKPWRAANDLASTVRKTGAAQEGSGDYIARMHRGVKGFGGPVLILLSERDLVARQFRELGERAPEWKAFLGGKNVTCVEIANTDHTFARRAALDEATGTCLQWLGVGKVPEARASCL